MKLTDSPKVFLAAGITIYLAMALTMIMCSLLLFVSITPSAPTLVASFLIAFLIACITQMDKPVDKRIRAYLPFMGFVLLIVVLSFAISIAVSLCFVDTSYDGNVYHAAAIASLKEGWDPLQASIVDWEHYSYLFEGEASIYIDHYVQGLWELAACLYALTGSFLAAKSYTLLAAFGTAFILGSCCSLFGLRWWQSVIIAFLAACNPITLCQFHTLYNDGFLMLALLSLLVGLFLYPNAKNTQFKTVSFLIIGSSFIACAGTKFTGFAFAGVFCLSFYCFYIYETVGKTQILQKRGLLHISILFAIVILISFFIVGNASYVRNLIVDGNPFYPLFGANAVDIMGSQAPESLQDKSNIEKFLLSLFSQTSNAKIGPQSEPHLKVPFTFTSEECVALTVPDVRIGGFGLFFSGILIVSIAVIIVSLVFVRKRFRPLAFATIAFLVPCILLTVGLGESWWARYCSFIYFLAPLALVWISVEYNAFSKKTTSPLLLGLFIFFALAMSANLVLFVKYNTIPAYQTSVQMKSQLDAFSKTDDVLLINARSHLLGNAYLFDDLGISYRIDGAVKDDTADGSFGYILYQTTPSH